MNIVGKAIEWYFFAPNRPRDFLEIVGWWEIRRIVYNLVIGSVGFVSLIFLFLFVSEYEKLSGTRTAWDLPIILLFAIFLNICYTAGELPELIYGRVWKYKEQGRPWATNLLKLGTSLSLIIVLYPSISFGIYLLLLKFDLVK